VLAGGTGWIVLGVFKMLGGALLAYLAISHSVPLDRAVDPNQMYLAAYETVFPRAGWAVAATAVFVVVSQLKINVTNAYAGSLAWSNFFARLTHRHPGRVVWVVFNTAIALMLMELDVFQALGRVLGLYGNVAISWMMAVVADLVVNKPLGWSPRGIEFKRAHLWDVNPVGVGAMGIASALSMSAYLGAFGPTAQACSALIAAVTAFACAPAIAWATRGRYYLARPRPPRSTAMQRCTICERDYEGDDVASCPAYQDTICSLCCSLDARCGDLCKPHARWSAQWNAFLARLLPRAVQPRLDTGLGHYLLLMAVFAPLAGLLFRMVYQHELDLLAAPAPALASALRWTFIKAYAGVLLLGGVAAWWLVLAHKSRQVAQEESNRQTRLLMQEIESHRRTDLQLQAAKRQAEAANQAKTRYLSAISHELRAPLNSILGYAQLLEDDERLLPQRRQAAQVIRRSGDHLLSLIEGTLDIARIEGGKLQLEPRPMHFADALQYAQRMFELQAGAKGLRFLFEASSALPPFVRADEKRLQQILFNLLGNAVKFTPAGEVRLRVSYACEIAHFEIRDTGPGMSAAELDSVFEPFARGRAGTDGREAGSGLGLTIAKMLTELMGGEMRVESRVGEGTVFRLRLFLPRCGEAAMRPHALEVAPVVVRRAGGAPPRVLVVDNEEADRTLLRERLAPLGFEVRMAASGEQALAMLGEGLQPDAILLDLAMPGLDGWQTLREMRGAGLSDAPVAIVSANAFDRGLDNDVGIAPEDFLVKPVARQALHEWLGRRLALQRTDAGMPQVLASEPVPDPAALRELREAARMGYPRGVAHAIARIEAGGAGGAALAARLRELARGYRYEEMLSLLARLEQTAREPG
jgi:signal transduction histidine kinase/CheY-like chemotaxis protein